MMTILRHAPLLLVLLLVGRAPGQAPLSKAFVEELVQRAQQQFEPVGLAVAVVQGGEVLAMAASGWAREGVAMTKTTLCNIASCTKAFTSASIAVLVQEGRLTWDDRVVDHVPEFKMADPWITSHMTVRDLLSHRCGLATFAGDLLWYGSDYGDEEVLRRIEKLPITQPFRGQFGYQNLMYLVAGIVVQRASGMPWERFVEQRFFKPLGMTETRAAAQLLANDAERAIPHIDGQPVVDHEFTACKPAASIYASVAELAPWMSMLLGGGKWNGATILTDESLREMWRPHVGTGRGSGASNEDFGSYGMGWFLSLERGVKVVEHDGGMPGFLSKVSLMPAEKFGFVVLNNSNDGVLNEAIKRAVFIARAGGDGLAEIDRLAAVGKRIRSRNKMQITKREQARVADTTPTLSLPSYSGRYEDATYGPAEVTVDGDGLRIVLVASKRRLFGKLSHWHYDTFRVDFPDRFLPFALVRFDFDHTAHVAGFRIDCPIADFDFGALDFKKKD